MTIMKDVILALIILTILVGGYYLFPNNSNNEVILDDNNVINCLSEQRNVDACIQIYQPVCAKVRVECVTTPCDPVFETFSNSCFACMNDRVISYTEGECQI
jgi:hypothetical protein